jgi:hypothetical protein
MLPEQVILELFQNWSPTVVRALKKAGYWDQSWVDIEPQLIPGKIGLERGGQLYRQLVKASLEKNAEVAAQTEAWIGWKSFEAGAKVSMNQLGIGIPRGLSASHDFNELAQNYFDKHGLELQKTLMGTDISTLQQRIQYHFNESPDVFAKRYTDSYPCSKARIELIKRSEYHTCTQGGSYEYAKDAGAEYKQWHCTHIDKWPRADHAQNEGQVVRIDEVFNNGQDLPCDPNCRCYITYHFDKPDETKEEPPAYMQPPKMDDNGNLNFTVRQVA